MRNATCATLVFVSVVRLSGVVWSRACGGRAALGLECRRTETMTGKESELDTGAYSQVLSRRPPRCRRCPSGQRRPSNHAAGPCPSHPATRTLSCALTGPGSFPHLSSSGSLCVSVSSSLILLHLYHVRVMAGPSSQSIDEAIRVVVTPSQASFSGPGMYGRWQINADGTGELGHGHDADSAAHRQVR